MSHFNNEITKRIVFFIYPFGLRQSQHAAVDTVNCSVPSPAVFLPSLPAASSHCIHTFLLRLRAVNVVVEDLQRVCYHCVPVGRILPAAVFLFVSVKENNIFGVIIVPANRCVGRWGKKVRARQNFGKHNPQPSNTLRYEAQVAQKNFSKSPGDKRQAEPVNRRASRRCLT